jgi:hypothetical protein
MSFNQIMKRERERSFYRRAARTQDMDDDLINEPDPRSRPGDPGGDDHIPEDIGDGDTVMERAARWLVRSGKTADIVDARAWLNTMRGATFLSRFGEHFGKRQRVAKVKATSTELVDAAKVHAVAKHPTDAPDVAFTKMIADPTDADGAAFRRVNAKLRHRELYGKSASAPTPAYDALTAKAEALRKADPKLSKEQAFAKAYDGNPELREAERAERYKAIGAPLMFEVSTTPLSIGSLDADKALEQINELARKLNREAPWMSFQQAWAKVYSDNPELARAEREQRRRELGA